MDKDQDEKDPLIGDEPEVASFSPEELKEKEPKTDEPKSQFGIRAGIVVGVLGLLFLVGLVIGGAVDEEPVEMQEVVRNEDIPPVPLEDIQARVASGERLWADELVSIIDFEVSDNPNVSYEYGNETISVSGNGIPNHETGQFPGLNPYSIREQEVNFSIPRTPLYVGEPTAVSVFGYSLGGIIIIPASEQTDPATGAAIETVNPSRIYRAGLDDNNGHPLPDGTYHYHGVPRVLNKTGEDHSNLLGFAADGFPVYGVHGFRDPTRMDGPTDHMTSSWRLKTGARSEGEPAGPYTGDYTLDFEYVADSGDLDQCNGRFTVTPDFPSGTYAYFVTEQFPFFPRCVMGELADSFL